jgi:hypothetical protein
MCNPAAERSGAKSESEFQEAKVKCIQSQPLLLSDSLNASRISSRGVIGWNSSCAREPALVTERAQSGQRMIV